MKCIDGIENSLLSRTNLITRYAFSVIMTDDEYEELKKVCLEDDNFLDNPNMYPWCHTKLLTETYLRIIHNKKINDNHTSEEIRNSLGIYREDKFVKLWKQFPSTLSRINLERKREEGGPWHIVANIRLHAGIPQSRLEELVWYLRREYKRYLNISDAITYLSSSDWVFRNMHLSKYVKQAFEDARTRKMLFSWLLKLIHYDINHNIKDLKDNNEIPPHLIQYFIKNQDYTQKQIILSKNIKQEKYEGLYYNEKNYNLYLMLLSKTIKKILPSDFPLKFVSCIITESVRNILKYFSESVECLVFDNLGKVLIPEDAEIKLSNKSILILSKEQIHGLGDQYLEMYDDWWGWFFYCIDFDNDVSILFPEPYGNVSFKFRGRTENKIYWLSNPTTQLDSQCPFYGGVNIPRFSLLSSNREFNPKLIYFEIRDSTCSLIKKKAEFNFDEDREIWIWKPPDITLPDKEYYLYISQFKFQFESEPLIELHCVWLKGFRYTLSPSNPIFPNEICTIKLEGLKNNETYWDTSEVKNNKDEPTEFTFLKKPEDTSPSIYIKTLYGWCNLMIKLNYITCYIEYGDKSEQRVKRNLLEEHISEGTLKDIIEIDYQAHIIICCLQTTARLSLLSGEDKIKEISLSKTYRDAILLNEVSIYNKAIYLINEYNDEKVMIISHIEHWQYKNIHKRLKTELIYKNSFFGGREYD